MIEKEYMNGIFPAQVDFPSSSETFLKSMAGESEKNTDVNFPSCSSLGFILLVFT